MIENNSISKQNSALESYTALNINSNVRGKLLSKNGKSLNLGLDNNKLLHIELREDIEVKTGETVVIDRSNIKKSELISNNDRVTRSEKDRYSQILDSMGIDSSEENIQMLKKMENFGVDLTRENFNTYAMSKNSLIEIASSLDYETALKLEEDGIDIENDSIEKIASALKKIRKDLEGRNLLDISDSDELSTEDAEKIAQKLYGSKMGRDITDIIKVLYKNDTSITVENIEKLNNTFYKLSKLSGLEDSHLVGTLKNNLDPSIDSLYRIKMFNTLNVDLNIDNNNIIKSDISSIKIALESLMSNLDLDRATDLLGSIDIENEDVRSLARRLDDFEKSPDSKDSIVAKPKSDEAGDLSSLSKLRSISRDKLSSLLANMDKLSGDTKESIQKIVGGFKTIGKLDFKTISIALSRNSSPSLLELQNIRENSNLLDSAGENSLKEALLDNNLKYDNKNIEKSVEIYRSYGHIKDNLSISMVSKAVSENIRLESMSVVDASKYVEKYIDQNLNYEASKFAEIESIRQSSLSIFKNGDNSILLSMRNQESLSLESLKNSDIFFKNKDQLGHRFADISSIVSSDDSSSSRDVLNKLRDGILAVQRGLKAGKSNIESNYRALYETLSELDESTSISDKARQTSELMSQAKKNLNENRVLQLPIMLNENMTNLNMYFKERKRTAGKGSSGEISVVVSLDTQNLGNINISLDIKKDNISIDISTENERFNSILKKHTSILSDRIDSLDLNLESISFNSKSNLEVFGQDLDPGFTLFPSANNLDIKI